MGVHFLLHWSLRWDWKCLEIPLPCLSEWWWSILNTLFHPAFSCWYELLADGAED